MKSSVGMRGRIIELLAQRRNYRQEIKNIAERYQYVVFYGCGAILGSIIDSWQQHIGRQIDFCCDSDSQKWGEDFRGIKCLSPQELIAIKDKCAVFVTIGEFMPVFKFLREKGFVSVNVLYKADLDATDLLLNCDQEKIASALCQTYDFLSDRQSQKVFEAIISRVLGDDGNIGVMTAVCEKHQYFPSDIIKLSENESFVDVGAYDGDTVRDFVARTGGRFDAVFSFEVDAINFKRLEDNIKRMPEHDRIKAYNCGAWDTECDITYSIGNSESAVGVGGQGKGRVIPLDSMLKNKKVSFIKMDIEGAEPQALRGAQNIIRKWKPKLAICIYHDFKHLWEIPFYIKELVPGYKIYLRHHTDLAYETVCYAIY